MPIVHNYAAIARAMKGGSPEPEKPATPSVGALPADGLRVVCGGVDIGLRDPFPLPPDAPAFRDFAREAGPALTGGAPWHDGWHVGAICDALQAVADGRTRRLLITAPPGVAKSTLASVLFPAWWWLRFPSAAVMTGAGHGDLALCHARRSRALMDGDGRFGPLSGLSLTRQENGAGGSRVSFGLASVPAGSMAGLIVLDQPDAPEAAEGAAARAMVRDAFDACVMTRLRPGMGAVVVVATRQHAHDLPGALLARGGWAHLKLPLFSECGANETPEIGFRDRRMPGEALWPERFDPLRGGAMAAAMGRDRFLAEMQQRPIPY